MRRGAVALAFAGLALAHCGGSEETSQEDVALPERGPGRAKDGGRDATEDAPAPEREAGMDAPLTACDTAKPFGAPTHLAGAWLPAQPYSTPRLSADELTVYFTTRAAAGDSEMGVATRASKTAAFAAPAMLTALNSTASDNDPAVSADHLSIWFHSARDGDADIYTATRATTAEAWGTPVPVGPVNSASAEAHAYYRQSANELWLISNRGISYDIYVSTRAGGTFSAPVLVPELMSVTNDWQPQPSEDGLTMLLASDRQGGKGGFDLYLSRRATTSAPWSLPVAIDELNSASGEQAGWLSADGCRIYFSSDRDTPGTHALFFAERPR